LKRRVKTDPQLKAWHEKLRGEAGRVLEELASRYDIPDGRRLLATSRRVLGRIYTLALLYRLDGDERYVERAWKELEAVANFKDWNPSHYLDTAEMTHAFAIAYDWLYDSWNAEQRALLRKATLEKGLLPALQAYRREKPYGSWMHSRHNWNQVCNGGIGMRRSPGPGWRILARRAEVDSTPNEVVCTRWRVERRAGLLELRDVQQRRLPGSVGLGARTDFGLSKMPGLAETGQFPIYLTGHKGQGRGDGREIVRNSQRRHRAPLGEDSLADGCGFRPYGRSTAAKLTKSFDAGEERWRAQAGDSFERSEGGPVGGVVGAIE